MAKDGIDLRRLAGPPLLLVFIDTEEEFDWALPLSRDATNVAHIRYQYRAQRIFDRFGLKPTYLVDYPVATQEAGYRPLREFLSDGRCAIGAHLHPWVNPPYDEAVSNGNSYAGHLPVALEREKLRRLGEAIEANFGAPAKIYRAGRYGIGPATGAILEELGYEIDTSIVPRSDFRPEEGPDFRAFGIEPFRFGPTRRILEIPLTVAWTGCLRRFGATLQPVTASRIGTALHFAGVLGRLGLFERIRLSPEGMHFAELIRLTKTLLRRGQKLFCLTYHSPSLMPGHTPYVRDDRELRRFLSRIEAYFEFFMGPCGGRPSTPEEVRVLLMAESETRRESASASDAAAEHIRYHRG